MSQPTSSQPPARRRRQQPHRAILEAALELLMASGYQHLTVEAIAARAGVGKTTIYRWWPSKAAVVLEAYANEVERHVPMPDTGGLQPDLEGLLLSIFRFWQTRGPAAKGLIAEAQLDASFAAQFHTHFSAGRRDLTRRIFERAAARGEIAPQQDWDFLVDSVYAPAWYRLLLGHAPLDASFARAVAAQVLAGLQRPE